MVYLFKKYWKLFYIEFISGSFFQINIFFKVVRLATCKKIDELDLWFNHSLKFKDPAGHLGTWYQRLLFRGTQQSTTKGVVLNGYNLFLLQGKWVSRSILVLFVGNLFELLHCLAYVHLAAVLKIVKSTEKRKMLYYIK